MKVQIALLGLSFVCVGVAFFIEHRKRAKLEESLELVGEKMQGAGNP